MKSISDQVDSAEGTKQDSSPIRALSIPPFASTTKAGMAVKILRNAIHNGQIRPGQSLKLTDLARDLDMSYTPLREAIQQLKVEGLVDYRPHASAVVLGLSVKRAKEIYNLRILLEPFAARLACENANYDDVDRLIEINNRLSKSVETERYELIPELNHDFHMTLYAMSGSELIIEFITRLWNGVPYQALSLSDRSEESAAGHEKIIEMLKTRDIEGIEGAVLEHITSGAKAALKYLDDMKA